MDKTKMDSKINKNSNVIISILIFIIALYNQSVVSQSVKGNYLQTYNSAQNISYSGLKERITFQSLPSNFEYNGIRCILKDYKGYMWFGTADGLVRFDGINSYVYEHDPDDSTSIRHNNINALVEDSAKRLWIGTSKGLNLYNREQDNFISVGNLSSNVNRLNDNYISSLCADKDTLLWVGTYGDGVNVYHPEKQIIYNYPFNIDDPNSLSSDNITCITVDNNNKVWIGTQNGLNLFSKESVGFRHFYAEESNPASLSNNNITSLAIDSEGSLWIGSRGGGLTKLSYQNGNFNFKRYAEKSMPGSLSNNSVLSLIADNRDCLWIGTENGGLNRLYIIKEYFEVFQVEEGDYQSISENSIWSLFSDSEGRIWIGTFSRGINVIDQKFNKFESYRKNIVNNNSITDNDVKSFSEDNQGNVWIAMDGGGICKFNPVTRQISDKYRNTDEKKYLTNNAVQAIVCDINNNLWIGTWAGGINRLDKNSKRIRKYNLESEQGVGNNNVMGIYTDSKGNIWAGTAGSGLFRYNDSKDKFELILCDNNSSVLTPIAYVTSLLEDSDGIYWIGTLYGLITANYSSDNSFLCTDIFSSNEKGSISSNMIDVIFEDSRGRIWLGTSDYGLNLFNKTDGTATVFQKSDGLPSNSIRGILEDDEGFLWITTNKGISQFSYDSLIFTNYTREDGLNSNEFYVRSCLHTKKGEFYMGGENGFNVFYPENIRKNNFIPPVYLTSLKINNVSAEIGAKNSPLKKHIGETSEIILSYKQSSFTIEFVALNYTRPARNQFSYMLEGFDDKWNFTDNNRSATYTNIKPGKYKFLVKGSNNDGIWNNNPTTLLIRIKPPLWKTAWAILTYLVLITALITVSLIIWNERIHIKHQLKLEQLGREKEHELNEANIQFFTNISHEFRTPLSLIIAPLESIILSAQSKIKEQLIVIYHNAQRLIYLTNNLMYFRKLEEGRTSLKVKYGEIVSFVREVSSYFNLNFKRRHIKFHVNTSDAVIHGWFDPEKLETIMLNLLSNASKYTPDGGNIQIVVNNLPAKDAIKKYEIATEKMLPKPRFIEIKVIDNGSGISSEDLPFIFDKYYQSLTARKKKNTGTGIGLALTKGFVELNHGHIKASSNPNLETCFSFVLPIDRESFLEDEIVNEPISVLSRTILSEKEESIIKKHGKELKSKEQNNEKADVLIVEDNYELRTFLARELNNMYTIIQAEDGKPGIELAFEKIPDLIVSDILMPQCSGIELCNVLKADIRTCHIPIILLTAKTTIGDQIEGVEIGADAYITKPFNMKLLVAKINQLIQSRRKLYAHFSQDVYIIPNKMTDNELDQRFLHKAIDYIITNIGDNTLNVEGLAVEMNLSRSNVYRKIKALTGKTAIEFIRLIRLKQAVKLMETRKYSLAEIAYMIGFTSPSYFTKSFRDQYGRPPSEYLTS
jgi:ligand-binding sensor domain-containing protein/signal transduction histidine kinase/DNA-binding response OmpR family regulator